MIHTAVHLSQLAQVHLNLFILLTFPLFLLFLPPWTDEICDYFGVKIAMYFAWLGFYTSAMVYPAVFGSLLYTFTENDQVRVWQSEFWGRGLLNNSELHSISTSESEWSRFGLPELTRG